MTLSNKTSYPQATLTKATHDGDVVIYSLELHNRPDNRLTPDLLKHSLLPALDAVEDDWRESVENGGGNAALITYGPSDAHRFYSNGLDLGLATTTPGFWPRLFNPLFIKLLTFPIPTIAAINGHAFAGGMCMALAHDYRIMKGLEGADKRKGCMMAMNEIEFGAAIPPGMLAVLKAKIPAISTLRSVLLEGKRFDGPQALKANLVDALAEDGPAVIDAATKSGISLAPKALPGAWGAIKAGIYEQALRDLAADKGSDGTGASVVANLERMAKKAAGGQKKQAKL